MASVLGSPQSVAQHGSGQNDDGAAVRLIAWHRDARARTIALVEGLSDERLMGPPLPIVNPLRWEVGHVGWFEEYWALRHARDEAPLRAAGDRLYDSARVAHDTRWDLPLPSMAETLGYVDAVLARAVERLAAREPSPAERYFHLLTVFHEDMHDEAFTYTRQTLAYPPPRLPALPPSAGGALAGDARIPGGTFLLGASPDLR